MTPTLPRSTPLENYLSTHEPFWTSDAKMQSMFSAFAPREVNETLYDSKLRWWRELLLNLSEKGLLDADSVGVFLAEDGLDVKFRRKGRVPLGLGTVLSEMKCDGQLVPISTFLRSARFELSVSSLAQWVFQTMVKSPIVWGFSQIVGTGSNSGARSTEPLVVIPVIKKVGERLLQVLREEFHYLVDLVVDFEEFGRLLKRALESEFPDWTPRREEMQVIVAYLDQQNKLAVFEDESTVVVKLRKPDDISTKRIAVTDVDKGIVVIKVTKRKITHQVKQLEDNIERTKTDILEKMRVGKKQQAVLLLRQRKGMEKVLTTRLQSLESLDAIIEKIRGAETDVDVLTAYSTGTQTLKSFMEQHGLTVEKADQVMDEVQDALADQREIDEALEVNQKIMFDEDLESCEAELEQLLAVQEAEKEKAVEKPAVQTNEVNALLEKLEQLSLAPAAPTTSPPASHAESSLETEKVEIPSPPPSAPVSYAESSSESSSKTEKVAIAL
ncbi:hypothetical protein HK102_013941 [Quaeritorhiza haematococci]|nr:hypothetical protein HK102_013941 [Quaeritorhiza haematococci]